MKKIYFIFLFYIISFISVHSQTKNPYIRDGSIGKNVTSMESETKKTPIIPYRSIQEWIGERFIFLPKTKSLQKFGYQLINGGDGRYKGLSYQTYVGRIMIVTYVEKDNSFYTVTFKMEDTGEKLSATAYSETIEDIAPIADIDSARAMWLGKTFWYKRNFFSIYNATEETFDHVDIKKYSPVKVIDVIAGWYSENPVRLILQDEKGNQGFEDLNVSNTNVPDILQPYGKFEDSFLETDPRQIHNWPLEVWQSIENGKVFVGMTKEQALFSWGKPKDVNRTINGTIINEQWVYSDNNYLYFEDDKLTSIQN